MTGPRLRVGFLTEHARPSDGWGRYAVGLTSEMRAQGVEPVLVTSDTACDAGLVGLEHHVVLPPLFRRRFETARSLRALRGVRRVLTTCDAVHVLAEPYLPLAAAAVPRAAPLVHTAHGTWSLAPLRGAVGRGLTALALARVDLLVCQSRFTRDRMSQRVPLPPHVVWPGGVRAEDFDGPATAKLPDWSESAPIVLTVGALKERKGHHLALDAVARASDAFPALRWVLIGGRPGSGTHGEALMACAAELGVADRVHLLGHVPNEELKAWYRRADVFLLLPVSSGDRIEGLGLVYLEAAAAGTPSVGSRDTGAAEAIADGESGLLVPQRDPGAAAAALVRLLGDAGERTRMGEAARVRARRLSWSSLAGRLARAYTGLLGGSRWPREAGA